MPEARADYVTLLDDLEANFTGKTQKLLIDDRSDLTVEIEVLRERLEREGVRMAQRLARRTPHVSRQHPRESPERPQGRSRSLPP